METQSEPSELELDDVVITNPHIEAILENEDWIEDASYVLHPRFHLSVSQFKTDCVTFPPNSGLVSHCISILKVKSVLFPHLSVFSQTHFFNKI